MKRRNLHRFAGALLGTVAMTCLLQACGGGGGGTAVLPSTETLSAEETAALKFMREEEKLAHDVYVALYALWGEAVFNNISMSETSHTEAILALLVKYGVPDPAAGNGPGVFTDATLQTLYNTLIALGDDSNVAALGVGALIEETDIHDINEKKAITDNADILAVYESLLCGSRNHLRAFDARLDSLGSPYTATVISQTEWDAIAASPTETCGI